ncbi:chromosomal replication initiator protein DnaA [Candidatus Peregrinibacteria bacterium]|nr:chromosomal replication initiator protein DnaA [Candidatus Peregrinibacteria bacterium]
MATNTTQKIDKKAVWKDILSGICKYVDRGHLLTIFVNSAILSMEEGILTIGFASIIGPNYVKEKYHAQIFEYVSANYPEIKEVRYEMKSSIGDAEYPEKLSLETFMDVIGSEKKPRKIPNKQEILLEGGIRSKILNKRYTLQNFIPGDENKLVHAACMAVGAKPAGIYNPLYIYGGVGLGKTHLLQATGHEILKNYPSKRVVYMTAEQFINKIVDAIGKKHTKPFKDEYRNLDCLIIDDIQFLANKVTSEQEFFHTFNELYDNGKQIILSADKAPRDLKGFDDRLRSRFGMGMLIEIQKPNFETRLAILKSKCHDHQVILDPEILEFIAYNVTNSVREMIGVLITIMGQAQLETEPPTIRSVAQIIRRINNEQEIQTDVSNYNNRVARNIDDVTEMVAKYFALTKTDLISDARKKQIMIPRQICMLIIRESLKESYETIGESFGGRNHTTVMHACSKIKKCLETDLKLERDFKAIKKELGI